MPAEAIRLLPFETEFTRAWDTPGHTRYRLPPDTDVNRVLAARYTTGRPLTVTRSMLWDMETRKAARPGTYIPFVVRAGSDRSWNRRTGDGGEYLDRCSMQRLWLNPQRWPLLPTDGEALREGFRLLSGYSRQRRFRRAQPAR